MESVERRSPGLSAAEIMTGLLRGVIVRVVNDAGWQDVDVSLITPTRKWTLSTSIREEPH